MSKKSLLPFRVSGSAVNPLFSPAAALNLFEGAISLKKKIFVLGGCRSGKSSYALETAQKFSGNNKVFIATCVPRDDEMKLRVTRHQQERSRHWHTVEAPLHLAEADC